MFDKVNKVVSPVYLVGGSVRDELLGVKPKDWDFATPLSPDEVEQKIRDFGRRPYRTGKRFGTLGFKLDGEFIEVTTFRIESYERGSRKPDVEFVEDLHEDLSRRDFTINAIAKRGKRIIDPFGGQDDLKRGIIKAVGSPTRRFKEDPLRMLRAARFASQLGFEVEQATEKSVAKHSYKILNISKERWVAELDKLLVGDNPARGLRFLADTRLLNFILPELSLQVGYDQNSRYHDFELWEHTVRTVELVPATETLRWAALLHDVAKPFVRVDKVDRSNYIYHERLGKEVVWKIARYLRWSNDRRDEVMELVANHLEDDSPLKYADNCAKRGVA